MAPDPWDEAEDAIGPVERQARRDQIEGETEARQLHLASRSLVDLAWEAMQQGDRVRFTWVGGEAQGVPSAAIEDLVVLPAEDGIRAINLAAISTVEVIERRVRQGSSGDRTLGSFVALCRLVEGSPVACHLVGGRQIDGHLVATAQDHIYIRSGSGSEVAAAKSEIAALSVAGDFALSL